MTMWGAVVIQVDCILSHERWKQRSEEIYLRRALDEQATANAAIMAEFHSLIGIEPKPPVDYTAKLVTILAEWRETRTAKPKPPEFAITAAISTATAVDFAQTVRDSTAAEIEVIIDSPGGEVDAAFYMASALKNSSARTTAILLRADSAALFVALGVDRRIVAKDGTVRLHNTTGEVTRDFSVTADQFEAAAADLRGTERNICRVLENSTGTPEHMWQQWMNNDRTMTAEAMLKHRLVDSISTQTCSQIRARRWAA